MFSTWQKNDRVVFPASFASFAAISSAILRIVMSTVDFNVDVMVRMISPDVDLHNAA